MTRRDHRDAIDTRVCGYAAQHGLGGDLILDEFRAALVHPTVLRLADLAGEATAEARAEGAARRTLSLIFLLAHCEHYRSLPDVRPDPDTARVIAALHHALGHGGGTPAG